MYGSKQDKSESYPLAGVEGVLGVLGVRGAIVKARI